MNLKTTLIFWHITISFLSIPSANAEVILHDFFDSGKMDITNPYGFAWEANNRTSIVIQDSSDGPVAVYNNRIIYNIHPTTMPDNTTRNWTPKTGSHSLRFNYAAGQNIAEQRFKLGNPERDIWIRYWLRVPTNYKHGIGSPSNHKLLAIWMDAYEFSGTGTTCVWETWNDGNNGSKVALRYVNPQITTAHNQHTPFITYPEDQGRWMQLVFHLVAATNSSSNDGSMELWRRWENEPSFTKLHEWLNQDIFTNGSVDGFKAGYIMGWANAPHDTNTEWLIDDFTVSTTSLISLVVPKSPESVRVTPQ